MRAHAHRTATTRLLGLLALVGVLTSCSTETAPIAAPTSADRALFGAFTYGGVWQGMDAVVALEAELGTRLAIVHWFTNWENPFYPEMALAVTADGRVPLVTWQPHRQPVADIASGVYDDYVRGWARGVASVGDLVYVRPFPEMNGSWVPWHGDPDALRAAWRRVARLFAEEGAHNVRWVFGPNVTDDPRTDTNRMERYYPGHDVVDVLALSGYNWGAARPDIGWRSFEDVFRIGYDRVSALGRQDVWLAEIASAEEGGDKATWVRDMFASTAFPRLAAIVWFDEDKEADWRVRSSPRVATAFREALRGAAAPGAVAAAALAASSTR